MTHPADLVRSVVIGEEKATGFGDCQIVGGCDLGIGKCLDMIHFICQWPRREDIDGMIASDNRVVQNLPCLRVDRRTSIDQP